MHDPIARVIESIKKSPTIQQAGKLTPNFLNKTGEVFEIYGFATTRTYLQGQAQRRELVGQVKAVLAALDCMEKCEAIQRDRAIGRLLIKTLSQHIWSGQSQKGGYK